MAYFMIHMEMREKLAFIKPFLIVAIEDMSTFALAFTQAFLVA